MVLRERPEPKLNTSLAAPTFNIVYAGREQSKLASEYVGDTDWVAAFWSVVKGVGAVTINNELMSNADSLALALRQRLDLHVSERVDASRHNHWTLGFTLDNIPPMAAAMCLVGHIVGDINMYGIHERLLHLPMREMFQIVSGDLASLEGCYLYFDKCKYKWIRSGKTSGKGKDASFSGRGNKHQKNSKSKDEMRKHRLYREYPFRDADNLGEPEGFFDHLEMYCGMAFDKGGSLAPLCSSSERDSLFVWSEEAIEDLKRRGGDLRQLQLDAVA